MLAGQYHPDKVSHLGEEFRQLAEKRFKEIQVAYQELIRNKKR
jgi:DnaJ-class molecular chaperone